MTVLQQAPATSIETPERTSNSHVGEADSGEVRGDVTAACLVALAAAVVVCGLYFGRDLIMPIVMATVLALLLRPLMVWLEEFAHLPLALAAVLVIVAAVACFFSVAALVSLPSGGWSVSAPETLAALKEKFSFLARPIATVQTALHNIESFGGAAGSSNPVVVSKSDALPSILFFGATSSLRTLFVIVLLLFFILASGDRLLRAFIEVLPRFSDKRRAVEIASEIQGGIASYLLTISLMNALVGAANGVAAAFFGLANPVLWGFVAFLLNFIPIVGPLVGIAIFFVVGVVALPWPFPALAPALFYVAVHTAEGQIFTPLLVARRFELNPVLVIVSLLFWDAIWGVPGAVLAVPLLAIIKIVCDRIEPLKTIGHLIGA